MRVSLDTNVLVRAAVRDDAKQARLADKMLREASALLVPVSVFCEFVWVIQSAYGLTPAQTEIAIEALLAIDILTTNRRAIEAGVLMLRDGGDFSDGVIAYEGRRLGGEVFVSFDKKAVKLLKQQGHAASIPD